MGAPLEIDQAVRQAGYQIVGSPIRGGMSTVYPARRLGSGPETPEVAGRNTEIEHVDVAIKVLHDAADVERLRREGELLGSADHPAIARFVEVGELSTGAPFLASAWISGSTLHAELVDNGPFDLASGLAIFEAIAGGLQHLHDRGIVHRDLSPDNVILGVSGSAPAATLIDFGISRSEASAYRTVGTELAGTPRYLAPEVISGSDPSPASDQYSAAILFQELLTGAWPYPESPTAANALHHQLSTAPTPLIETLPGAPVALDQAIQRALSKDPASRFESMDHFVAAIHEPRDRPATDRTSASRRGLALAAVIVTIGVISVVWLTTRSDTDETAEGEWAAGDAAALECNTLEFTDFDNLTLPRNWYVNPIDEAAVDVVESGGQDNSPALRIGLGERYGLWGEDVPIEPGVTYVFAGTFISEGNPFAATMKIEWYDIDSNGLLDEVATVDLAALPDGRVSLSSTAPANARFAVVQVFKDASEGSLLADELVLARADDPCAEQL